MKAPEWKLARLTLALLIESELPSWLHVNQAVGSKTTLFSLTCELRCRESIVNWSQITRRDLKEEKK